MYAHHTQWKLPNLREICVIANAERLGKLICPSSATVTTLIEYMTPGSKLVMLDLALWLLTVTLCSVPPPLTSTNWTNTPEDVTTGSQERRSHVEPTLSTSTLIGGTSNGREQDTRHKDGFLLYGNSNINLSVRNN